MNYRKFHRFMSERSHVSFVKLCLKRAQDIEAAYGRSIDDLVQDDNTMYQALVDLEWRIGKSDLDNYQNVLRHYYEMAHGHSFTGRVLGNRRLND